MGVEERNERALFVRPRRDQDPAYEEFEGKLVRGDLMITITDPEGIILDVSTRLLDDFPGTEEVVEIDLLELAHGDTQITLDDQDLAVTHFLTGAREGEEWVVDIRRQVFRRRQKWEPVFSGILDIPWSIETDEDARTVALQVFSFSKVLENTSAEGVKRTFAAATASTTTPAYVIILDSGTTAGLVIGDVIALDDDVVREEHEIVQINSATVLLTKEDWVNTFSEARVEVLTPFYRDKGIPFLVEELFRAAGITSFEINVRNPLNKLLFPSPMSRSGLQAGEVESLLDEGGFIHYVRQGGTAGFIQAAPDTGWTIGAAQNEQIDWRPNTASEPGTVELQASFGNTHDITADHVAGRSYQLKYYPAVDQLWLERDGVDFIQLEGTWTIDSAGTGAVIGPWTQDDYIWYSFKTDATTPRKALKYHRVGSADEIVVGSGDVNSKWLGDVQNIRALGITVFKPHAETQFTNPVADTDQLHVYPDPVDADPPTLLGTVTVPRRLRTQSLRGYHYPGIGDVVAGIYYTGEATKMKIWRLDSKVDWVEIADFTLRGADTEEDFATDSFNWVTIFDHARNDPLASETVFLVAVTNELAADLSLKLAPLLFVVSTQFIGVIPYADFEGMSVGKALKELALATMSIITVDHNRIAKFVGRAQAQEERDAPALKLDTPLERRRRPLWEFFRDSVEVRGETSDGTAVGSLVGLTGSSAKRQSFSSTFVNSEALAFGIATQYLGYLNQRRTEEEIVIREPDQIPQVLQKVTFDGRTYLVSEKRHNYLQRRLELRLYELEE